MGQKRSRRLVGLSKSLILATPALTRRSGMFLAMRGDFLYEAEAEFDTALRLNPGDADILAENIHLLGVDFRTP